VIRAVSGIHACPGVVANAQVGNQDCKPRELFDAVNGTPGAIQANRPLNFPAAGAGDSQAR
jgi:hypothetical protein